MGSRTCAGRRAPTRPPGGSLRCGHARARRRALTILEELREGDEFAGHRILGVAGRGGMGVVYRALQLDLERVVALKLIATPLALDEDFRERFVRESRAAAGIDHPNVIPVFYAGEHESRLYIAMRYVDGEDLRSLVRRDGGLDPRRAARIVSQVGAALDAAHARGLVHRDIKPANVLLAEREHAYLTDFGLTKQLQSEATVTGSGRWVGTLGYVAPEQIRGEPIDARADVYALGCLLFFCVTGIAPYRRETDEATLWAHLHDEAPLLGDVAPGAPPELDGVIARALAKDPEDRFPSAGDLGRAALAAAGAGPAPPPERLVARGAAAPAGASDEDTASAPTPATTAHPASMPLVARLRSLAPPAAALAAGAATVLVTAALVDGDGDGVRPSTTTTTAPRPSIVETGQERVDARPNGIAYARGRVWTTSLAVGRLVGLGADSFARRRIDLPGGRGTQAVAAGYDSLWTVNSTSRTLVRIDPDSGRVQRVVALPPGEPVVVATGSGAVWVGARRNADPASEERVLKIDPATGAIRKQIVVPSGVRHLAVGEGAVWVVSLTRDVVTRIDIRTGRTRAVRTGAAPARVAVGLGYAWVTNAGEGTVTQISPRTLNTTEIAVGQEPTGVDAGGRSVWVANRLEGTVTRIDPATSQAAAPVRVGRNPFAIVARGTRAWVTLLGDDAVARVEVRVAP